MNNLKANVEDCVYNYLNLPFPYRIEHRNNSNLEIDEILLDNLRTSSNLEYSKDIENLKQPRYSALRNKHLSQHKENIRDLSNHISKQFNGQDYDVLIPLIDENKPSMQESSENSSTHEMNQNIESEEDNKDAASKCQLRHEVLAQIPFEYRQPNLYKELLTKEDFSHPLRTVRKDSWSSTSSDEFNSKWHSKAFENHRKSLLKTKDCRASSMLNRVSSIFVKDSKYSNKHICEITEKAWKKFFRRNNIEMYLNYNKRLEALPNWVAMLPKKKFSDSHQHKSTNEFESNLSKDKIISKDQSIWKEIKTDNHVSRLFQEMNRETPLTSNKKKFTYSKRNVEIRKSTWNMKDCTCKKHPEGLFLQDMYSENDPNRNYPTIVHINNNNKNPSFKQNMSDDKGKSLTLSKKLKRKISLKKQDSKKSEGGGADDSDSEIGAPNSDEMDENRAYHQGRGSIAPTRRKSSWMPDRLKAFEEELKDAEVTDWSAFLSEAYRKDVVLKAFKEAKSILRKRDIPECVNHSANVWNVLKNNLTKDFTRIALPINYNEPLSMLQRLTEDFCYANLLHKAADKTNSIEQLIQVAAFSMSKYAFTYTRMRKPFNPLLGETYECDCMKDRGWRSVAEQVSHHPPIAAQYIEAEKWTAWQESSVEFKFNGKSLQITPLGTCHVVFHANGHHYTFNNCIVYVQNLLVGSHYLDYGGLTEVINHNTGELAHIYFHSHSVFNKQNYKKLSGCVGDQNGNIKYILRGTVDEVLEGCWVTPEEASQITSADSSKIKDIMNAKDYCDIQVLWNHHALMPANSDKIYNFNQMSLELNFPESNVAPTDSRLRPDIRFMEEGYWDLSNKVKAMLEEHQRTRAKLGRKKPKWFKLAIDPLTNTPIHAFTGEYWKMKSSQSWPDLVDIYFLTDDEQEEINRLKSMKTIKSSAD